VGKWVQLQARKCGCRGCGTGMRVQAQLPGGGGVSVGGGGVCAGVHVQVGEWVQV